MINGQVDTSVDAGFFILPARLGDFVWVDATQMDNKGKIAGGPGLNGRDRNTCRWSRCICTDANGAAVVGPQTTIQWQGNIYLSILSPEPIKQLLAQPTGGHIATTATTGVDATDSDPAGGVTSVLYIDQWTGGYDP